MKYFLNGRELTKEQYKEFEDNFRRKLKEEKLKENDEPSEKKIRKIKSKK